MEVPSRELPRRPGLEGSKGCWEAAPGAASPRGHCHSDGGVPCLQGPWTRWGLLKGPEGVPLVPGSWAQPASSRAPGAGVLGGMSPQQLEAVPAARQRGSGARWGGRNEADGWWAGRRHRRVGRHHRLRRAASAVPHQGPQRRASWPAGDRPPSPAPPSPPGSPRGLSPAATATRPGFSGSLSPKLPSPAPPTPAAHQTAAL